MIVSHEFRPDLGGDEALGRRIFFGAFLGIGFQMFNQTFASFGLVYGIAAGLSATLPTLFALGFGAWRLTRSPL